MIVAGGERAASALIREIRRSPAAEFFVVGASVAGAGAELVVDGEAVPVLGEPDGVADDALRSGADVIAVADGHTFDHDSCVAWPGSLRADRSSFLLSPTDADVAAPLVAVRPVTSLPLLHVEEPELSGVRRLVKAIFDRCAAGVLLVLLLPFLLLVGLLVRLTSRGPALFKQSRVGLDGRTFLLWKFRSMTVDAEERLVRAGRRQRARGPALQNSVRPPGHPLRADPAPAVPRRAAAALERPQGRHVAGRPRPPLPSEVERYCHRVRAAGYWSSPG